MMSNLRLSPTMGLHPHQVATIAAMRGLKPPFASKSRILVYGLHDGGDLIPLASYLPTAQLVGVDTEATRLERAKGLVEELGLANVELVEAGKELVDLGRFDYILVGEALAHLDLEGRAALLSACSEALSESGLLALGYPAKPGWQPMSELLTWLRQRVEHIESIEERIAQVRRIIEQLLRPVEEGGEPPSNNLALLADTVARMNDIEVVEMVLDPTLSGLRLPAVVEEASVQGLHYLGDSQRLPSYVQTVQLLGSTLEELPLSIIDLEVLGDMALPRVRRTSVFSRSAPSTDPRDALGVLEGRLISAGLRPEKGELDLSVAVENFTNGEDVTLQVESRLLRVTLSLLAEMWPGAVPVLTALDQASNTVASANPQWAMEIDAEEMAEAKVRLLHLCALGLADLHTEQLPIAAEVDARPRVHDLLRYQTERGPWVTSPLHIDVRLGGFLYELLRALDGKRDADLLEKRMTERLQAGAFELEVDGEKPKDSVSQRLVLRSYIVQGLRQLRDLGLLRPNSRSSDEETTEKPSTGILVEFEDDP